MKKQQFTKRYIITTLVLCGLVLLLSTTTGCTRCSPSLAGNIHTDIKKNTVRFNCSKQEPPPAMSHFPQCIVKGDSIQSYKNYYIEAKAYFAKWTNREIPQWFSEGVQ